MKMKSILLSLSICLTLFGLAQEPPNDPLRQFVFPPELVMQNQSALNLNSEQATYILGQIQDAQRQFTGFQWKLQGEFERLTGLLSETGVDEQAVLTQLDKILDLERQIKRTHLTLAVRIKNRLTPEQQAILQRIRGTGGGKPSP